MTNVQSEGNIQPEGTDVVSYQEGIAPTKMPEREGQRLSQGKACIDSNDCSSQWCLNGHCAQRTQ